MTKRKPKLPVSTVPPMKPEGRSARADIFATIAEEESSESVKTAADKLRKASEHRHQARGTRQK